MILYILLGIATCNCCKSRVSRLPDKDDYVRSSVAYALGEIGNDAAVNLLIYALNHQNYNVRSSAADALEKKLPSAKIAQICNILLNGNIEAKKLILEAQERYKFYNHKIFHL